MLYLDIYLRLDERGFRGEYIDNGRLQNLEGFRGNLSPVCTYVCMHGLSNETIVTRPLCVLDLCSRQRDFLRQSRLLLDPWKVHVSVESIEIRDDKE